MMNPSTLKNVYFSNCNTSSMKKDVAMNYLSKVEEEMKLPTVDPVLTGTKRLAEELANF